MTSTPRKDGIETKTADGVVDCHFIDEMFELIMKEVKRVSPDGIGFYAYEIIEELITRIDAAVDLKLEAFRR